MKILRWRQCPFFEWCPYKMAPCRVLLPDNTCYLYRYFLNLIMEDMEDEPTETDN